MTAGKFNTASAGISPLAAPGFASCQFRVAVATMPCDLQITPHPLGSSLFARLDGEQPLVDAQACQRYAQARRQGLAQRLQDEAAGRKP